MCGGDRFVKKVGNNAPAKVFCSDFFPRDLARSPRATGYIYLRCVSLTVFGHRKWCSTHSLLRTKHMRACPYGSTVHKTVLGKGNSNDILALCDANDAQHNLGGLRQITFFFVKCHVGVEIVVGHFASGWCAAEPPSIGSTEFCGGDHHGLTWPGGPCATSSACLGRFTFFNLFGCVWLVAFFPPPRHTTPALLSRPQLSCHWPNF